TFILLDETPRDQLAGHLLAGASGLGRAIQVFLRPLRAAVRRHLDDAHAAPIELDDHDLPIGRGSQREPAHVGELLTGLERIPDRWQGHRAEARTNVSTSYNRRALPPRTSDRSCCLFRTQPRSGEFSEDSASRFPAA